jgi:hypothetical protein
MIKRKALPNSPIKAHSKAKKKREGTKLQKLEAMLRRPEGGTITQIAAALDWQPHSVRGAISGALKKKRGLTISAEDIQGGERTYRIPN